MQAAWRSTSLWSYSFWMQILKGFALFAYTFNNFQTLQLLNISLDTFNDTCWKQTQKKTTCNAVFSVDKRKQIVTPKDYVLITWKTCKFLRLLYTRYTFLCLRFSRKTYYVFISQFEHYWYCKTYTEQFRIFSAGKGKWRHMFTNPSKTSKLIKFLKSEEAHSVWFILTIDSSVFAQLLNFGRMVS